MRWLVLDIANESKATLKWLKCLESSQVPLAIEHIRH